MTLKQLSLQPFSAYNINESFDEKHQLEQQLLLERLNQLKQRQITQQQELLKLQIEQLEFEDDNYEKTIFQDQSDFIKNYDNESSKNDILDIDLESTNLYPLPDISESICNSISNSLICEVVSLIDKSNSYDGIQRLSDFTDSEGEESQITKDFKITECKQIPQTKILKKIKIDEKPIKSKFSKITNYEDYVEKELASNDNVINKVNNNDKILKKPFLKKGQGLTKYYHKNVALKTQNRNGIIDKKQTLIMDLSTNNKCSNIKVSENKNIESDILVKCNPNLHLANAIKSNSNPFLNKVGVKSLPPNQDNSLEEFEIIESALDNSSFSSNLSTISKIVLHHNLKQQHNNMPFSNNSNKHIMIDSNKHIFDDEDTWDSYANVDESCTILNDDKTLTDPINSKQLINNSVKVSSPPVSKLISKFFPKIETANKRQIQTNSPKNSDSKIDANLNANQVIIAVSKTDFNDNKYPNVDIHLKMLKDRIQELELEIKIFKDENAALLDIKQDFSTKVDRLKNETLLFEKQKLEETEKFEQYKADQIKKLNKEKKIFETFQKNAKDQLTRKEREEIDSLKREIANLQESFMNKTQKLMSNNKRLKDRVTQLEEDNLHLKKDILILEENRISKQKIQDNKLNKSNSKINLNLSEPCIQILKNGPNSPKYNLIDHKNLNFSNPLINQVENCEDKFKEIIHGDGRIEHVNVDGSREIYYANGTKKEIAADGISTVIAFFNGDIKKVYDDNRIMYYYAEAKTRHTTYANGLEVFEFPNDQVEKHFLNGKKEIIFPDRTIKYIYPDGTEESVLENGTVIRISLNGDKIMEYTNGQKEIHNTDYKRREYPDGTVKTIYPDGRQETRYPTGRLRIKDKEGVLIVDTCI